MSLKVVIGTSVSKKFNTKRTISTISSYKINEPIQKNVIFEKLVKYGLDKNKRMISLLSGLPDVIDPSVFNGLIDQNVDFQRAISGALVVPDWEGFVGELKDIFHLVEGENLGGVAAYIPQLSEVNPDQMALSVTTVHGQMFQYGDSDVPFCVQSTTKPFSYSMASDMLGSDVVHQYVGREPSGKGFNERVLLNHLPHNPMINSGAIMCASLIRENIQNDAKAWDYVIDTWKKLAGDNPIGFMNAVYLSEKADANRNYCLAYMMREEKALNPNSDITANLNFYFMSCSIEVTARIMSIVASTLANSGINPLTRKLVFTNQTVRNCLSLMLSCGLYDYSGEFLFKLGLPGKSGVSGVIIVPIVQVMGICFWSPRLDRFGNSYRGIKFFTELGERFQFHFAEKHLEQVNKKKVISEQFLSMIDTVLVQLFFAAYEGDMINAAFSVGSNVNINMRDYDGRTALHLAASEGHLKMVRYLVSCGADITQRDRFGATAEDDAIRENHLEVAKYLQSPQSTQDFSLRERSTIFKFFDVNLNEEITKSEMSIRLRSLGFDLESGIFKELLQHLPLRIYDEKLVQHSTLLQKITEGLVTIPRWKKFCEIGDLAYEKAIQIDKGEIYTGIPYIMEKNLELNAVDEFAVVIRSADGQKYSRFNILPDEERFTLQALSSLLNYCIALETLGFEKVHSHVGFEPSGEEFNSLVLNVDNNNCKRPHNPFTNAGALTISSLLFPNKNQEDRYGELHDWYFRSSKSAPIFNKSCYLSESSRADRNIAISYILKENKVITELNVDKVVDFYIMGCSLEWTLDDIAVFGATLANNGVNPLTGENVFSGDTVRNAISMMYTAGMNTHAGEFAFTVGMPGKSSVSGVTLAIVPNVISTAAFSPKLDLHGNSIKADVFLEQLTNNFRFHMFDGNRAFDKIDPTQRLKQSKIDASTLLSFAAAGSEPEITMYLEGHQDIDVNISDYDGRTMAHVASAEGKIEVVKLLQTKNADFTLKDRWGKSALDELSSYQRSQAKGENAENFVKSN